jgi:hypothetical protein
LNYYSIRSILLLLPGPLISGIAIYFALSEFSVPFRITISASILIPVLTLGLANYYRTYGNNEVDERSHNVVGENTQKNNPLSNIIFIGVYLILIIFSLLAVPNTKIFIHWEQVTPYQLMSLAAAIVLCIFAPGYALISTIDRRCELSRLSRFLIAYLLSILVTGLSGYIVSSIGIAISHANIFFCFVNLLILAQFVFIKILDRDFSRSSFYFPNFTYVYDLMKQNISKILVFGSLAGLVVVSTYVLYNGTIVGDQWFHYGRTFMFLSGAFKDIAASEIDIVYPVFFNAYLATFFTLSSMPSVNSYASINFMNMIPVFAFYYFFSKWIPCHRKTVLLASSLFMLSSGFGWIYALNLAGTHNDNLVSTSLEIFKTSWIKTFDIFTPNTFVDVAHPETTTNLIIIALPAGFVLLGLIKECITNKLTYTILIATICILGLLTHEEFVFFIIVASITPLIFRLNQNKPIYIYSGILLGIALVIFIAVSLPGAKYYYMTARDPFPLGLIPLSFLFVTSVWLLYASRIISKLQIAIRHSWKISRKIVRGNTRYIFAVAIMSTVSYFYILSFLVWDMQLPIVDVRTFVNASNVAVVPWHFYPLRFGITGLLAFGFIISYIFKKYEREVLILGVIAIVAFLTGPYYNENRFNKYIMAGMAGFASLMLYQIISSIRQKSTSLKNVVISGLLIGFVITSGSLSVLMYAGYSALTVDNPDPKNEEMLNRRVFPSDSDMHLMDFLRHNLKIYKDNVAIPERELFTDQGYLSQKIHAFAGQLQTKLFQTPLILQEPTLNGFYKLLKYTNTRFIVLPRHYINSSSSMSDVLKFALNNFPKSYEDANYVVLAVPLVSPPSAQAGIALISPRSPDYYYYYSLSALALSKASYDIYEQGDFSAALSKKMIILTSDPSPAELFVSNYRYLEYVKNGGTILIMNKDFKGAFSNLLCIKPDKEKHFDGIAGVNGQHLTVFGETTDFRPSCSDYVVKAFYVNNGQEVAPFVIETAYGRGKIIFVNPYGYFTTMSEHPTQFFSTLGNVTGFIGIKTNHIVNISAPNVSPFPYFFGGLNVTGPVSIEDSSVLFPSSCMLDVCYNFYAGSISLEKQDQGRLVYNSSSLQNKDYFSSSYVKNLKLYGAYNMLVNSTNLLYSPSLPVGSAYIPLDLSAGSDMTIKLFNGSRAEFVVGADDKPVQFVGGGEIKFKNIKSTSLSGVNLDPSVPVLLRAPEITIYRNATFLGSVRSNDPDNPGKFTPPWNDYFPRLLQVRGETILKLDHVAISNGKYTDGEYITYFKWIKIDSHSNRPQAAPVVEPFKVPWKEFFSLELNTKVIISILIAGAVSVYIGLSSPKKANKN